MISEERANETNAPDFQRARRAAVGIAGALAWALFAGLHLAAFLDTGRPIGLGYIVQASIIAGMFLIRAQPVRVSGRSLDWLAAFGGTFGGLLLRPDGYHPEWGDGFGLALQAVGVTISIVALFKLGRSFGLVAAHRGLVMSGPFSIVRHPIYAAYLVGEIGYLMQSFSLWNVAVLTLAWVAQIARMNAEERLLSEDAAYAAYRVSVPRRLIPGVW